MTEQLPSSEVPQKNESGSDMRIRSIDSLKGLSIMLVMMAHLAKFLFVPEEQWIYYLIYTLMDVFGPSMFVFLSSLSVVFTVKKKPNGTTDPKVKKSVFQRALMIFIMGCIPNIIVNSQFGFLSFWYWFVLQFMAFSQIITYYSLRIHRTTRLILAFLIIFVITPNLFDLVVNGLAASGINYKQFAPENVWNPYGFIYWFVFFPMFQVPLLPWAAIPLMASITGEALVYTMKIGTPEKKVRFAKGVIMDGFLFLMFAVVFGSKMVTEDYGMDMMYWINTSPSIHIDGIPEFLIMHSNYNILYNLGMALILLGLGFYFTEVKKMHGRLAFLFDFYGKFSLTLFCIHPIVAIWFPWKLTFWYVVIYVILSWMVLYYFLKWLVVKHQGVGTLEWFILKLSKVKSSSKSAYDNTITYFQEKFDKIKKDFAEFHRKNRDL